MRRIFLIFFIMLCMLAKGMNHKENKDSKHFNKKHNSFDVNQKYKHVYISDNSEDDFQSLLASDSIDEEIKLLEDKANLKSDYNMQQQEIQIRKPSHIRKRYRSPEDKNSSLESDFSDEKLKFLENKAIVKKDYNMQQQETQIRSPENKNINDQDEEKEKMKNGDDQISTTGTKHVTEEKKSDYQISMTKEITTKGRVRFVQTFAKSKKSDGKPKSGGNQENNTEEMQVKKNHTTASDSDAKKSKSDKNTLDLVIIPSKSKNNYPSRGNQISTTVNAHEKTDEATIGTSHDGFTYFTQSDLILELPDHKNEPTMLRCQYSGCRQVSSNGCFMKCTATPNLSICNACKSYETRAHKLIPRILRKRGPKKKKFPLHNDINNEKEINKSNFIGVSFINLQRWKATAWIDGKNKHCGYHPSARDAALAVNQFCRDVKIAIKNPELEGCEDQKFIPNNNVLMKSLCEYSGCQQESSNGFLSKSTTNLGLKICHACRIFEIKNHKLTPRFKRKRSPKQKN